MTAPIAYVYLVSGLIEVFLPLVLAFYAIKRMQTSWKIWFVGALMFLISLIRFPLNNYLSALAVHDNISVISMTIVYLIPAVTAGLFEETARYVGLKYLIKDTKYRTGITYGLGHGGIESIFLVGINILTLGVMLIISPDSMPSMLQYVVSLPIYMPLVGAYERVMVLVIQISLSIMVLETLRTKKIKYFATAIIAHIAVDYISLSAVSYGVLYAELVVTGFAIGLGEWAYSKIKNDIMA